MRFRPSIRTRAPRSRTTAAKRLTRAVRLKGWLDLGLTPEQGEALHDTRPRTRGECADVPRPCPYVSCAYSLYLDVNPETGSIKLVHPTREPWEMPADASCALDVAERGGMKLEAVGEIINVVRERARQIEASGLAQLSAAFAADGLDASDAVFPHREHMTDEPRIPDATRRAQKAYRERQRAKEQP